MLAVTRALAHHVMARPSNGPCKRLAPVIVDEFWKTPRIINAQGITTVNANRGAVRARDPAVLAAMTDITFIVFDGSVIEVLENESLRAEYQAI